jgi:RNA polymerase sigma-70 factor (ECF subfamily)
MDYAGGIEDQGEADALLVERTLAGDHRAYALLVIKYQRRIQRLIGRMVRDVDLIEDIAQDTFISAFKALHQFRGDAKFYTWLYRIAVNCAKKTLLELKHQPLSQQNDYSSEDETFSENPDHITHESPESLAAAKELAAMVNMAMDELADELRQAICLREIDGLSYEEIAAAMVCPVGTVRSRIFRAREAISEKIRPLLEKQTGKRW